MWQKIVELARLVWSLGQKTERNSEDIHTLQAENKRLTAAVTQLIFEVQRLRDEIGHLRKDEMNEREKMALRLENELLKFERRLPPGKE